MRNKKLQVWLPLVFSLVMIAGMFFGFRLSSHTTGSFFARPSKTNIEEAFDIFKDRYVDNINLDSLQNDAINEMMNHLDPHSTFIPASNLASVNEDLAGSFEGGIGIEFNIFDDTVHILYVIPDGPSDKAGIRIGDKLIAVDGESVISKTLPSTDIRKMIRGKGGSKVNLTVIRGETTQYYEVLRGTIPIPSVDAAYMVNSQMGFIKLNKFSEPTYREFMTALERLQKAGMKDLILDLRGNGGGYIDPAIEIADEFLDDDKLIVYTEGANVKRREYKAKRPGLFETGKLAILIDEQTASASEILTGALQDWDRATILGRRSFGKGLVQGQYTLSDGSAIRLTIARYYTPIGRSIQRPYDQGRKAYMEDIQNRYLHGEMFSADSISHVNQKVFNTAGGRKVYGGGGITPDVFVPYDTSRFTKDVTQLYLDGRFNNIVYQYYIRNSGQLDKYKSPEDFSKNFNNIEAVWSELVQYALKDRINLRNIPERDKVNIQNQIKSYLARLKWRTEGYYEVYNKYDPVVMKAVQTLGGR